MSLSRCFSNAGTNNSIDAYVHGRSRQYVDDGLSKLNMDNIPDIKFITHEVKALVQTTNGENVTDGTILNLVDSGKMGIMLLDINPSEVEYDPYTELKLWKTDSSNILIDKELPDKVKITSLPKRDIYIMVGKKTLRIHNTKIIEIYTDKKRPFKFAIMFEKITY